MIVDLPGADMAFSGRCTLYVKIGKQQLIISAFYVTPEAHGLTGKFGKRQIKV